MKFNIITVNDVMVAQENLSRILEVFDEVTKFFSCLGDFEYDIGLSKNEIHALNSIFKYNKLNMSKLAENLDHSFSASTKIIDRLIEKDLVVRERNQSDRRVVRVALTKKGEEIVLAHQQQKKASFEKILSMLTPEEQESLISILEKVVRPQQGK